MSSLSADRRNALIVPCHPMRHAHCGLICGSAAGTARARLRSTIIRCRIDDCAASRTADRTGSVDFAMLGNGLEVPPRVPDPTWRWPWPSVRPNGHRGHPRKRPNGPFRPDEAWARRGARLHDAWRVPRPGSSPLPERLAALVRRLNAIAPNAQWRSATMAVVRKKLALRLETHKHPASARSRSASRAELWKLCAPDCGTRLIVPSCSHTSGVDQRAAVLVLVRCLCKIPYSLTTLTETTSALRPAHMSSLLGDQADGR
jgi:hypothetical protein